MELLARSTRQNVGVSINLDQILKNESALRMTHDDDLGWMHLVHHRESVLHLLNSLTGDHAPATGIVAERTRVTPRDPTRTSEGVRHDDHEPGAPHDSSPVAVLWRNPRTSMKEDHHWRALVRGNILHCVIPCHADLRHTSRYSSSASGEQERDEKLLHPNRGRRQWVGREGQQFLASEMYSYSDDPPHRKDSGLPGVRSPVAMTKNGGLHSPKIPAPPREVVSSFCKS